MTLGEYKESLDRIPYGKRLPTALYIFREECTKFGEALDLLLEGIVARCGISGVFNVVKFRTDELKVSFLSYPEFVEDAHPALRHAVTVDLVTGKARHTDYADNHNPPILHRKESFLPPEHPLCARFQGLTEAEEAAGLYEHTATIGFRLNWEKLLKSKGLEIRGHSLRQRGQDVEKPDDSAPVIERHKTALEAGEEPAGVWDAEGGHDVLRLWLWTGQRLTRPAGVGTRCRRLGPGFSQRCGEARSGHRKCGLRAERNRRSR
jgi:hypothetical protein